MDELIKYLFDLRIVLGAIIGAVIMFFVARKNPKWVEDTYQQQRALSMQGTEEVDKLKKQIAELEIEKFISSKTDALKTEIEKLKAQIKG